MGADEGRRGLPVRYWRYRPAGEVSSAYGSPPVGSPHYLLPVKCGLLVESPRLEVRDEGLPVERTSHWVDPDSVSRPRPDKDSYIIGDSESVLRGGCDTHIAEPAGRGHLFPSLSARLIASKKVERRW